MPVQIALENSQALDKLTTKDNQMDPKNKDQQLQKQTPAQPPAKVIPANDILLKAYLETDLKKRAILLGGEGWDSPANLKKMEAELKVGVGTFVAEYQAWMQRAKDFALPMMAFRDAWKNNNPGKTDVAFIAAYFDKKLSATATSREAQASSAAYRAIIQTLGKAAKDIIMLAKASNDRVKKLDEGKAALVQVKKELDEKGEVSPATVQALRSAVNTEVAGRIPVMAELPPGVKALLENPTDVAAAELAVTESKALDSAKKDMPLANVTTGGGGSGKTRDPLAKAFSTAMLAMHKANVPGVAINETFKTLVLAVVEGAFGRKDGDKIWTKTNEAYDQLLQGLTPATVTKDPVPPEATNVTPTAPAPETKTA